MIVCVAEEASFQEIAMETGTKKGVLNTEWQG